MHGYLSVFLIRLKGLGDLKTRLIPLGLLFEV